MRVVWVARYRDELREFGCKGIYLSHSARLNPVYFKSICHCDLGKVIINPIRKKTIARVHRKCTNEVISPGEKTRHFPMLHDGGLLGALSIGLRIQASNTKCTRTYYYILHTSEFR